MAIIGFERFDIGAWVSEGMLAAAPKARQPKGAGSRKGGNKASLVVALSAVVLMSFPAEPSAAALLMRLASQPVRVTASGENVPKGYWPRAITAMKSWRNVQSDVAYPDPVL